MRELDKPKGLSPLWELVGLALLCEVATSDVCGDKPLGLSRAVEDWPLVAAPRATTTAATANGRINPTIQSPNPAIPKPPNRRSITQSSNYEGQYTVWLPSPDVTSRLCGG